MKTVYVVAWHYDGGAGFDWYAEKDAADMAFQKELENVAAFADSEWTAYQFEHVCEYGISNEAVTAEIDGDLDGLCLRAEIVAGPSAASKS